MLQYTVSYYNDGSFTHMDFVWIFRLMPSTMFLQFSMHFHNISFENEFTHEVTLPTEYTVG